MRWGGGFKLSLLNIFKLYTFFFTRIMPERTPNRWNPTSSRTDFNLISQVHLISKDVNNIYSWRGYLELWWVLSRSWLFKGRLDPYIRANQNWTTLGKTWRFISTLCKFIVDISLTSHIILHISYNVPTSRLLRNYAHWILDITFNMQQQVWY